MSFFEKCLLFLLLLCSLSATHAQKISISTKAAGLFIPQTTFTLIDAKTTIVAASGLRGLSCIDSLTGKEIGTYTNKNSFICTYSGGGTYVYALTDAPALLIFDVKKPTQPSLKKTIKLPRQCSEISLCGKTLVVYSPDSPYILIDVSKIESSKIIPTEATISYQQILAYKDLFLCRKENSLYSFSPSAMDKTSAAFLTTLPLGAGKLVIHNETIYLMMNQSCPAQITVSQYQVEISDSTLPEGTSTVFSCAQSEYILTKKGSILKQSTNGWIDTGFRTPFLDMNVLALNDTCWFYHSLTNIFRVSFINPEKPIQTAVSKRDKKWTSVTADKSFLISGSAGTISIYSIKSPAKPVKILEADCDEAPLWMFYENNYLSIFCAKSARVYLFEGEKTLNLISAFMLNSPPLQALRIGEDFYLACGTSGLMHFSQSSSGILTLHGVFAEKKADVRAVATDGESIISLDSGYGALYFIKNAQGSLVYKKRVAVPGGIISAVSADDSKVYLLRNFAPPAILEDSVLYDAFFPSGTPLLFTAKYAIYADAGVNKISSRANLFISGTNLPNYNLANFDNDTLFTYSDSGLSVLFIK